MRLIVRSEVADVGQAPAKLGRGRRRAPCAKLVSMDPREESGKRLEGDAETHRAPVEGADDTARGKARAGLIAVGLVLATAACALLGWWVVRVPGEQVGELPVPGKIELGLVAGDELTFTADTDILFDRPSRKALPEGCLLRVALVRAGDAREELSSTSCDLFQTTPGTNISGTSQAAGVEGKTRLRVTEQRLGCTLEVSSTGPAVLRASSNLDTCVTRSYAVVAQVHRVRGNTGR